MFDIRVVIFSETIEREARELLAAFNSMYIQFWRSNPFLTVKWYAISKKKKQFYLIEFLRKILQPEIPATAYMLCLAYADRKVQSRFRSWRQGLIWPSS